jgi:hypothetical protein
VHNVNNVNDNSWSVSVLSNERDKRMRNSWGLLVKSFSNSNNAN